MMNGRNVVVFAIEFISMWRKQWLLQYFWSK